MAKITKDTIIGDILDIAPDTAPISSLLVCTAWAVRLPVEKPWSRPAWFMVWMWRRCWIS